MGASCYRIYARTRTWTPGLRNSTGNRQEVWMQKQLTRSQLPLQAEEVLLGEGKGGSGPGALVSCCYQLQKHIPEWEVGKG